MESADRRETLAELLGISEGTIRWGHPLAFFIALLASDLITTLIEPLFRGHSVITEFPLSYWVGLPAYNLVVTACLVVAFRYQRRQAAAAALAAVGYAVLMIPVRFLLQHLAANPLSSRYSPLVAAWSSFAWAFLLLLGLVLALRWLRSKWLALGVGAAVGGWVGHAVSTATWWLTRPDRSTPFSFDFRSELESTLSTLASAALFALLIWLGLEIARAPKGRVSKRFFLGSFGGGSLLVVLCRLAILVLMKYDMTTARAAPPAAFVLLGLAVLLSLYVIVVLVILIHKMWAAIQDGHARATPGKAVGLLFVPVFNLYWGFQVLWGFAKDYNHYVDRHGLNVRKLPTRLFLVFTIQSYLGLTPVMLITPAAVLLGTGDMVILLVLAARICDAVNALPESVAKVDPPTGAAAPSATA